MSKQTNLEWIRQQNAKFLDDLDARVRAGGASASEFVRAVGWVADIEAVLERSETEPSSESIHSQAQARLALAKAKHIEAQTEALEAARIPEKTTQTPEERNLTQRTSVNVARAILEVMNTRDGETVDVITMWHVSRLGGLLPALVEAEERAMEELGLLEMTLAKRAGSSK